MMRRGGMGDEGVGGREGKGGTIEWGRGGREVAGNSVFHMQI